MSLFNVTIDYENDLLGKSSVILVAARKMRNELSMCDDYTLSLIRENLIESIECLKKPEKRSAQKATRLGASKRRVSTKTVLRRRKGNG